VTFGRRARASAAAIACAVLTVAAATCADDGPGTTPNPELADSVATVTLSPDNPSVGVGATLELRALLADSAGAPVVGPSVEWQTTNANVARIEDAGAVLGIVTGVVIGTVTITATLAAPSGDKVGTTIVTVVPSVVANVAITPSVLSLAAGRSEQLTAVVTDAQGNVLTGRFVQWASTSGSAIVDDFGRVTGVFQGTATITATCEGQVGSAYLVITAAPAVQ
jgi:uncharacterized protein YjdB